MRHDEILHLPDWPEADREMWAAAILAGGFLDDAGPLSHLSAETHSMVRRGYGKWLSWLLRAHPEQLAQPPADRAEPQRLLAFLQSLEHLSPPTQNLYFGNTLRLLTACHPDRDWAVQKRMIAKLHRQAGAHVSHRKDGRVLSGAHVLKVALDLAGPQAMAASHPRKQALMQRDGTILAFLALIPLRRRSFVSLELGRSILMEGAGFRIDLGSELTKTKIHWDTDVPMVLLPTLKHYIEETRPQLMARCLDAHASLWVTKDGDPFTGTAMSTLIRIRTTELFGVTFGPHLFRDIAATTLARVSPEAVGHVRPLLGHAGHRTAEAHYNQATALEVGREHSRMLSGLRE